MDRIATIPSLSVDTAGLDRIRAQAAKDPQGAIKGAAQQFEALLLGMVLKNMRGSLSQNTPFDSEQTRMFQSMLDQQLAQELSKRGTGLAELLVRQLGQAAGPPASPSPSAQAPGPTLADRLLPVIDGAARQAGSKTRAE